MKPKEYVQKYNLDTNQRFPHNELVADLSNDFISNIEYLKEAGQLNYTRFQNCIKEIKAKFDGIANKSCIKLEVWDKLWKYFYASVVVKLRDELFGEYLQEQRKKREERRNWESSFGGFYNKFDFSFFFKHFIFSGIGSLLCPSTEFALLEITESATEEEVKTAYRKKAFEYHPDKGGDPETFKRITEARNKCLAYVEKKI